MVQQVKKKPTREEAARWQRSTWAKKANDEETGYAIYHEDDLLVMGTALECADYLGIKVASFFMKMSPSHQARNKTGREKRLTIICLDDEEDDE